MMGKYQNKYRIPTARLQTWNYASNAAYFITICTQNRQHSFGEIIDGKMEFSTIGFIVEHEWTKTPALRPDMNLELGGYTVMPNHFHAILIIGNNKYNTVGNGIDGDGDGGGGVCRRRRDAMHGVSTMITTTPTTTPTTPPTTTTTPTTPTTPTTTPTTPTTPPTTTTTPSMTTPTTTTTPANPTIVNPTTINNTGAGTNANQFGPQSKNLASIIRGFKSAVTTYARKNGIIDFAWQPRFHDHIIRDAASFERIQNYIANNPSNWKEDKFNCQ